MCVPCESEQNKIEEQNRRAIAAGLTNDNSGVSDMIETDFSWLESGKEFPFTAEQWRHFEGLPTSHCKKALLYSQMT